MRRLLPLLLVVGALAPVPVARAQPPPAVRLSLTEQSPWNGPQQGRRVLELGLRIENAGPALDDVRLGYTVYARPSGRLEYEHSLVADPTVTLFAAERDLSSPLRSGETRTVAFRLPLDELVDRGDTGVYPMKLELRADDVPVATLRTPIVFVVPNEETVPIGVATTVVLADRLRQDPSGTFLDVQDLEAAVQEDGWLASTVARLRDAEAGGVTLAVSPLLLRQLSDMADGYRTRDGPVAGSAPEARGAGAVLDALGELARRDDVELARYPFAAPSLPALAAGGLDADIELQLARGAALTEEILGVEPAGAVVRPPGGAVDADSLAELDRLREGPGPAILLDADGAIPPEEELGFAPVATGRIQAEGAPELDAILPSASLQAVVQSVPDDAVLRAQAALGELAVIHSEQPGQQRGIALLVGERVPPDPAFLGPFLAGVRSMPLLAARTASQLLQTLPGRAPLELGGPGTHRTFSRAYEGAIRDARAAIERFRAMFPGEARTVDAMRELVLLAESEQFIGEESLGRSFLEEVQRVTARRAGLVRLAAARLITLTGRSLELPVTIRNLTGGPVRVRVRLLSSALRFGQGGTREVTLDRQVNTIVFPVRARRGGRFPVDVVVCTPGSDPEGCTPGSPAALSASQIVVRSTVYNRVALLLTIGAAAFLFFGWVRRLIRRGRGSEPEPA